jgi:hypothetical protein
VPSNKAPNLAHHWTTRALCIAAKYSRLCRLGVISLGGDRGRGPVYVRSTSNRVEILCTAVKDAKCQGRRPCLVRGLGVTGVSLLGADPDEKVTRRIVTIRSHELLERLLDLHPHLLLLDLGQLSSKFSERQRCIFSVLDGMSQ